MIFELLLSLILNFCSGKPDNCEKEINKCMDVKTWEYLDNSVNADLPDQYYFDFFNECLDLYSKREIKK